MKSKTSPALIGCLGLIGFVVLIGIFSSRGDRNTRTGSSAVDLSAERPKSPVSLDPQLELVRYSWHIEYGYAIVEGQVRNISSRSLENVVAVTSFYDGNSDFIASSDALIDYNPILPGQTSPFKVMKTQNPAMKGAAVEFKYLMGRPYHFEILTPKQGRRSKSNSYV